MDKEYIIGLTGVNMTGSSLMMKFKDLEYIIGRMEKDTKDSGSIARAVEMEYCIVQQEAKCMKGSSKMVITTDMEPNFMMMELSNIMAILRKETIMDMGYYAGLTRICTMASGRIVYRMGLESIITILATSIRVIIRMTRSMEVVSSYMPMELSAVSLLIEESSQEERLLNTIAVLMKATLRMI